MGNSNIVFWEGGRYDGRDATDCADLLLQGLIAWWSGDCSLRGLRGGSWNNSPRILRSADRDRLTAGIRIGDGFRVVRTLTP